jgi:hypothetical protein
VRRLLGRLLFLSESVSVSASVSNSVSQVPILIDTDPAADTDADSGLVQTTPLRSHL